MSREEKKCLCSKCYTPGCEYSGCNKECESSDYNDDCLFMTKCKYFTSNERLSLPTDMVSYRNLLAMRLNNDLIFKNGQNFVKICNEFIGE